MKRLLLLLPALLLFVNVNAQQDEVIRLSEPVAVTETHEIFGENVPEWDEALTLSEVIKSLDRLEGSAISAETLSIEPITIETEVAEVCQKKGCFFIANDGEFTARVTFKDYGFFVPTDSQGKKVKLVGTFSVKELSEEQAKHYAEDAGKNPDEISGPQKEYSIVATSVLIPKKQNNCIRISRAAFDMTIYRSSLKLLYLWDNQARKKFKFWYSQ